MFRKSHLLPTAPHLFNSKKQLTKGDFTIYPWGTLITIRWSKTIQFCERVAEIPLPLIPCSSLCPTSAIGHAFRFTAPGSSRDMQAFNWVDSANVLHVFTYTAFVTKLHYHLPMLGLDPRAYAGDSFCRGGASFAYQSGISTELIKALGDWGCDTILIYLTIPLQVRLHSANMLCKVILLHTPSHSPP